MCFYSLSRVAKAGHIPTHQGRGTRTATGSLPQTNLSAGLSLGFSNPLAPAVCSQPSRSELQDELRCSLNELNLSREELQVVPDQPVWWLSD